MKKPLNNYTTFDYVNILLMLGVAMLTAYPLWFTVVGAFNEGMDYMRGGVYFWPREFTLTNFQSVFLDNSILDAFKVTVAKCVVGTLTSLFFTAMISYVITRPNLKFKKFYIPYIMITMFFSGGLIPYFMLIDNLGLYDTFLVYIMPTLFSAYNMIIIQSFMRELPESLIESAKIDGASEYRVFWQIILPLSKPVLATIALFTAVNHWNAYFDSMMYTSSQELQTIQLFLKKVITDPSAAGSLSSSAAASLPSEVSTMTAQSIKFATMTVSALPIVVLYPFLQKYFTKGITMGSVKG